MLSSSHKFFNFQNLIPFLILTFTISIGFKYFWFADDAFMILVSVKNFVLGHGLTFNILDRVQAFTSPLWTVVLIPIFYFLPNALYSSLVCSFVCWIVLSLNFSRIIGSFASLSVFFLSFSYTVALRDYLSSGLETPLLMCLWSGLVVVLLLLSANKVNKSVDIKQRGWLYAAIILTRLDQIILLLPVLVWDYYVNRFSLVRKNILPIFIVFLWFAFATFYYGFPIPNTAYAKLPDGLNLSQRIYQGISYVYDFVYYDILSFSIVILGTIIGTFFLNSNYTRAISIGNVFFFFYVVWIGGDFMTSRYFIPIVINSLVMLLFYISSIKIKEQLCITGIIILFSIDFFNTNSILKKEYSIKPNGIANEMAFHFAGNSLLTNSTRTKYGFKFQKSHNQVFAHKNFIPISNPGLFAFNDGLNNHYIDILALSDPFLAQFPPSDPIHWRVGHIGRNVPVGYIDSLMTGQPKMHNKYFNDVFSIIISLTRESLFNFNRLKNIFRFHTTNLTDLINKGLKERNYLPLTILSTTIPEGSPWSDARAIVMPTKETFLLLPEYISSSSVDIQLDHNDSFDLYVGACVDHKFESLEKFNIVNSNKEIGLVTRRVEYNQTFKFNCIKLVRISPDPLTSIGGIKFYLDNKLLNF